MQLRVCGFDQSNCSTGPKWPAKRASSVLSSPLTMRESIWSFLRDFCVKLLFMSFFNTSITLEI